MSHKLLRSVWGTPLDRVLHLLLMVPSSVRRCCRVERLRVRTKNQQESNGGIKDT